MFNFLRRLATPELHQQLSIRERAIQVFSDIEGLNEIKEMMLRALQSHARAHKLLVGPPSCAKSMFMLEIEKYRENQHKEIIIIDEIDKMAMKDQEVLLTMMERGAFISTKVRNTRTVKANMVIFATSNSTERLSKPLLSRLNVLEIPEYTYPEFEGISTRIVNKLPQNTTIQIASSLWKSGSRDIRDVLKIAKLCNPAD